MQEHLEDLPTEDFVESGKMVRKRDRFFDGERYLQMEGKLWKNHASTFKGEREEKVEE